MITGQELVEWVNRKYMELGNEGFMQSAPFASLNQYNWFKNAKWDYNLLTVTFPNKTYKFRTSIDYVENSQAYGVVYYLPENVNDSGTFESPLIDGSIQFQSSFVYIKDMKDVFEELYFIVRQICNMFNVG